jgi:hypothetical protein
MLNLAAMIGYNDRNFVNLKSLGSKRPLTILMRAVQDLILNII